MVSGLKIFSHMQTTPRCGRAIVAKRRRKHGVSDMRTRAVIRSLGLGFTVTLALAACESKPTVRSNYDNAADFGRFHTYNFVSEPGTNREGYSTLLTQQIEAAVSQQMQQRGYTRSDNPDLLVNFSGKLQERQEIRSTPAAPAFGGYYGYRAGMYGTWAGYPGSVYTVNYKQGTLNVDVVDASRKQMVWEGVGVNEVTRDKMKNPDAAIHQVVDAIFQDYPFRAGQSQKVATKDN
jgi:hypothetical protein